MGFSRRPYAALEVVAHAALDEHFGDIWVHQRTTQRPNFPAIVDPTMPGYALVCKFEFERKDIKLGLEESGIVSNEPKLTISGGQIKYAVQRGDRFIRCATDEIYEVTSSAPDGASGVTVGLVQMGLKLASIPPIDPFALQSNPLRPAEFPFRESERAVRDRDGVEGRPCEMYTVVAAPQKVTVVAAEDIPAAGLPLSLDRVSGRVALARADTYVKAFVFGIADASVAAGFPVTIDRENVTLADWSAATGGAFLVAGRVYYLAATGGLSLIAPTDIGNSVVIVGVAVDARTMALTLNNPILL